MMGTYRHWDALMLAEHGPKPHLCMFNGQPCWLDNHPYFRKDEL